MQPSTQRDHQHPKQGVVTAIRTGEKEKFWYRSDRFIKIDNQWYFTTRENREVGPFESKEAAEHGLSIFIECICKHDSTVDHAVTTATQGDWAVTFYH